MAVTSWYDVSSRPVASAPAPSLYDLHTSTVFGPAASPRPSIA